MSTRSIKTLISTTIGNEVYDSNRVARLVENLESNQEKLDILFNNIGNVPEIVESIDDLSANVATLNTELYAVQTDISGIFVDISGLQGNIATINAQIAALPSDLTGVTEAIQSLEYDVSLIKIDISGISANVAQNQSDIADLSNAFSLLPSDIGSIVTDVSNLEGIVRDLSAIVYPVSIQTSQNTITINDLSTNVYSLNANNVKLTGNQTIGGNKTFSGFTLFGNTTPASSTTGAAVVISGGLGISKNAYVKGIFNVEGDTYHVGNIYQTQNNTTITQFGTGTNTLKSTNISTLTVESINGITNDKLQYVNSTLVYDLVTQGGIVPNSISEITSTLQTLLNAKYTSGHRHFYLPKGTYIVQNIELGQGTFFYGDGKDTILILPNSYSIVGLATQSSIFTLKQPNITLKDITIDGNRNNINLPVAYSEYQYEGVALDSGANYTTLENVYIQNTYNDGLDMDSVNNCIVRNCFFSNCGGHAIHMNGEGPAGYNCVNNLVDNCIIENCGITPISPNTFSGIHCNEQAGHNSISNVTILNCAYGGITNSGANNNWTNIVVRTNLSTGIGILISATSVCTNIDTVIVQGGSVGIDCKGSRSVISSVQLDSLATKGIDVSGSGNTFSNLSLNAIAGSPLIMNGINTLIDDVYMNGIAAAVEIYGSNNMLSNFAIRAATKKWQIATSRSSFSNFHWIDSDASITDTYVLNFVSGASYNSFANMNYSGNRAVHFESATACLYNRFLNGYIASGFTSNVLTATNSAYILGVNTSSGVVNLYRGTVELGPNDNLKQTGTGILDQSGSGVNTLKSSVINGNLRVKTNNAGVVLVSIPEVAGTNGQLFLKADASNNDYNTLVDARDTVIAGSKGTANSGVLTLTTESNQGDLGMRITDTSVFLRAPFSIEVSGNLVINGVKYDPLGSLGDDVAAIRTDVSNLQVDVSNVIGDISNIKVDVSKLTTDVSSLKLADIQNVKITGDQDISGIKSFTSVLNARNTTDASNTTTGGLVVSGGLGVARNMHLGGNLVMATGNIVQSGASRLLQSGTGTNLLKTTEMIGQLGMSYQSIIDVSAIIGANIVIQPNNNVVIQGDRPITMFPRQPLSADTTTKNGIMLINNAPYSAGMVLEQTNEGNLISYGINMTQFGNRLTTVRGGIFRFDTRPSASLFSVITQKAGQNAVSSLAINDDGDTKINSTTASSSFTTGAFTVNGGVGISAELYVGGIARIVNTTQSTSVGSGALAISGGLGVSANVYIGGNVRMTNTTEDSTSTATGGLVVSGGLGVARNMHLGGNITLATGNIVQSGASRLLQSGTGTNLLKATEMIGTLDISYQSIIDVSAIIGKIGNIVIDPCNAVVVSGPRPISIYPNSNRGGSRVLLIDNAPYSAGMIIEDVPTEGNVISYGINTIQFGNRDTSRPGGIFRFDTRGGTNPLFSILFNKTGANNSTFITPFQIDENGDTRISATTSSTNTTTGAFVVGGGVGIGENLNVSGTFNVAGQTRITNTTETTSAATGALAISGGLGVAANVFIGGNSSIGGNMIISRGTSSTSTATGALRVSGGAGIGENLYVGGVGVFENSSGATSTATGTLRVAGGVGIGGNIYVGGQTVIRNTSASLSSSTTGALQVDGGVGIGGNAYVDNMIRFRNNVHNKQLVLWDGSANEDPSVGTRFYGFGINSFTLRYQTDISSAIHRFYSGPTDGILVGGNLLLNTNNTSISSSTGTLRVTGGVGIGGNINIGESTNVSGNISADGIIKTSNTLRNKKIVLYDSSTNETPDNATLFYGFGVKTNELRYQTDASSAVHRFYSGNANGILVGGNLTLLGGNTSLDASSGALVVVGGVGIGANLNVRGRTVIENTTSASTTTSAAFVVQGGVGIVGDIVVGGNLLISGATSFTGADISGITTFRNENQSLDPSGGAVIIYGGVGVGKDINVRGNITLGFADTSNVNLVLYGNTAIVQNGIFGITNTLKATKLTGNLDVSFNNILDVSSIVSNGNITLSSTKKVSFSGDNPITLYPYVPSGVPNTTKNALYMNEPAKSGIATESNSGNALVVGINTSHLGTRENTLQGAIAKFDSRVGQPIFAIEAATGGAATTVHTMLIDGSYNTTLYGNTLISNDTEATSTSAGAFQVKGGSGIGGNLYVGGNVIFTNTTNASSASTGALRVAGGVSIAGNVYMTAPVSITDTTTTTDSSAAALRVAGGLSVGGNVFAERVLRIANANNNKKLVLNDLSVNEPVSTATQFTGFGVNTDALRYQSETATMAHKFYSGGVDGILQAGNLTLTRNIESTATNTGTLLVSGGAGISGNVNVGGNFSVKRNDESTSSTTGSAVFSGGVGIAANVYVGGNISVVGNVVQSGESRLLQSGAGTNLLKATEMFGPLDMSYQSIINVSSITGENANIVIHPNNNVVIQGDRPITMFSRQPLSANTTTKSGIMLINNAPYSAGMILEGDTSGNLISYGINMSQFGNVDATFPGGIFRFDTRGSTNPLFSVNIRKKNETASVRPFQITEDETVKVNTYTASTSTTTGAFIVNGGVGISAELYVGGITRIANTTESTSVGSGAFVVSGGMGVGANVYVGGNASIAANLSVSSTTQSTSTSTGAFTVRGGAGIGGNLSVAGNLVVGGGIDSTSTSTGTFIVDGGAGISQTMYLGGHLYQADNKNIYQSGGSTIIQSGSGTNTMKAIEILNSTGSTNVSSGALIVNGGAGIAGNVSALKLFIGEPTRKETEVDIQGNVCVGDKVSTYPVFSTNYPRRTMNIVDANASLKIADYNATTTPILEMESWNATTHLNTWTMQAGSDVKFQHMSGTELGTVIETLRIDPSYVFVPSVQDASGISTGAFRVAGGASVNANLVVGRNVSLSSGNIIQSGTSIITQDGSGTNVMKALTINDTTDSTTATTGAFIVIGGVGIGGNVFVGSQTAVIDSTSQGALRVSGGVGIAGNIYVGGVHRMVNSSDNKKVVVFDEDTTEAVSTATNFYGFGQNTTTLRYQTPTGATHKFYSGSSGGNVEAATLTLTSTTASLSATTGALIVGGGAGVSGNAYVAGILNVAGNATFNIDANVGGNLFVGVGKQVVITTDTRDNSYNTLVDANDSVVAGVDSGAVNSGVLTLTTFSNQGDVGLRITNQNITAKAPDAFDMAALLRIQKVSENFTLASIVSDTVTVNYSSSTSNSAYYVVPTGTNNLTFNITNVPTGKTYCSYTLTFVLDTSTYKVYGSTIKVNGTTAVLKYGLGSAHLNINDVSLAIQQVVIFFTTSTTPNAVLTSVTGYI